MDSHPVPLSGAEAGPGPLGAPRSSPVDFLALPRRPRYCPTDLLAGFALLMAGHGRCVNTDMMLGDTEYAMWQLSNAKVMEDPELSEITMRLCGYFDDPRHSGVAVLGTA